MMRHKKGKQTPDKPGSVSSKRSFVIYLLRKSPCASSILPSIAAKLRASNPQAMVYMNLQPPAARYNCHQLPGGLLHHLLTLAQLVCAPYGGMIVSGGYFLLPYPVVANSFYFRKWSALCCPDFPLVFHKTSDKAGSLLFRCKDSAFLLKTNRPVVKK